MATTPKTTPKSGNWSQQATQTLKTVQDLINRALRRRRERDPLKRVHFHTVHADLFQELIQVLPRIKELLKRTP